MNQIEPNHNLSFSNDFSFLNEFSSGIGYCLYEQQIELSIGLLNEKTEKKAFTLKIKQILSKWKKLMSKYTYQTNSHKENQSVENSQFVLKKISTETAWVSSLLALTSLSLISEITPIWSEVGQNSLNNISGLQKSVDRLFPLLAIEEIESIIFGQNEINNIEHDFGLSPPINSQAHKQEWLMYPTKANGSLMAIPPLYDKLSVAGFPSFMSTLDFINFQKDFNFNQFNLFNKSKLLKDPLDSVTYDIEDKLMATPKAFYQL